MVNAAKSTQKRGKGGVRSREVIGILLLAFSIFAIISLYVDTAGIVGIRIRDLLHTLFGDTAVVFTTALLFLSINVFRGTAWPPPLRKTIGFSLLLLSVATIYHLIYYRGYQFPPSLMEEIEYARRGEGAGIVGAVCLVFILTAFGIPGSYVMVGAIVLIGLIFYFGISVTAILKAAWQRIMGFFTRSARGIVDGVNAEKAKVQNWYEERKVRRLEEKQYQIGEKEKTKQKSETPSPEKSSSADKASARKKQRKTAKKASTADEPIINGEQLELNIKSDEGETEYTIPPTYLLKKGSTKGRRTEGLQKDLLEETFASFGISAKVVNVFQGPVVTRYELQPAPGIKVSRITALADDLALALAAADVRIEAPVPGKPVVGIEVPNKETEPVLLRDVLESPEFVEHPSPVALALGKDIAGKPVVADLKKWLHVLVAGATGSGKSVCLNAMIVSILFRANPDEVKLLMIDPKRVELAVYDGVPHLISPVVTDPRKAAVALRWAVGEMERRYKLFAEVGVRNIDMYEELPLETDEGEQRERLPFIVIIVDELADLMMVAAAEVEDSICRLAQMARAAGMYLIIATQRPSVDVITGLIKANVPSRISFAVSSQVDSRTILDMGGAERLIGKGDMLYYPIGAQKPNRAQGAWVSDQEIESVVNFWKRQGEPEYEEVTEQEPQGLVDKAEDEDELLEDAIRLVVENGQASISMLQRRFRIGYSRAARLIDVMEVRGIVGSYQGSKPREVLVDSSILEER